MSQTTQLIAEANVGRAMQAIETHFGIDMDSLKKRISKLIYYTAEDVEKEVIQELKVNS